MKTTIDLNKSARLLTYDADVLPHEIRIRLPDTSDLISILGKEGRAYFSVVLALALYCMAFVFIPAHFYGYIEDVATKGKAWIFIGFAATLVAGILVFVFAGHRKETAAYFCLSIALIICVAFVVFAASTRYGLRLVEAEANDPERIYWTMIAQNGLLVLGGGFAGNLFLEAVKGGSGCEKT